MQLVISLNNKNRLYDYKSMGVHTFVLGCQHSFYAPYLFNLEEIKELVEKHSDCDFYVAINALYDQHMMCEVEKFIEKVAMLPIKGIVFQDFGVLQIIKEHGYTFEVMYSPETLNTNAQTLNVLHQQGVTEAFISRVIPLEEQLDICQSVKMPLMLQVHGIEYIAASKRMLLTNYEEASHLHFDKDQNAGLTLLARNSDYQLDIYEDEKGTHIFSHARLYALDLFNQIQNFDKLYIETMMMDDEEAIEIVSLYSDALSSFEKGTYNKDVHEYMGLLYRMKTPIDRGFLFDQTVYKLEDMRKMDDEKR